MRKKEKGEEGEDGERRRGGGEERKEGWKEGVKRLRNSLLAM